MAEKKYPASRSNAWLKKTTSLTLAFSGLVLAVTSAVLYIGPPSHVGHFSPWQCFFLSRHYWGALHLNSGILFCLALGFHTVFNWQLIKAYVKRPAPRCNPALWVSLVLTLYVCAGGCLNWVPMKQVMDVARSLKMASVAAYGSPPYGTARAYPIAGIAGFMGWDATQVLARLDRAGMAGVDPGQSLASVAQTFGTTTGRLLDIMAGELPVPGDLPASPSDHGAAGAKRAVRP